MSNNYLDYWIIAVIIILNLDLPDKLYLTFATEDKVLEILRAIDTTKATGFDKFLEEFLKDFFDKISLRSNGPNVWKYGPENTLLCVACVKSQFPSDFFQTFVNCWIKTNKKKRKISKAGPFNGKVLCDHTNIFLKDKKILYKYWSGFFINVSTYPIAMLTFWKNIDEAFVTSMEPIDLQKTFATINPDVLLPKLNATSFLVKKKLSSNLINYIVYS